MFEKLSVLLLSEGRHQAEAKAFWACSDRNTRGWALQVCDTRYAGMKTSETVVTWAISGCVARYPTADSVRILLGASCLLASDPLSSPKVRTACLVKL